MGSMKDSIARSVAAKSASATAPAAARKTGKRSTEAAATAVQMRSISLAKMPKTGELIARELRKRIVRGELAEGSFLPSEAELMAQLSVSRASLREALRILESESLLTVKRGSRGGPIVHYPNPAMAAHYFGLVLQTEGTSLEDVYMARMLIEPPAVRLVAEGARRKAPALLIKILKDERAAVQAGDGLTFGHEMARFHSALVELTGNKTLLLIMRMLNMIFEHHMDAIHVAGPGFDAMTVAKGGLKVHERLIDLIAAGDADGAVTLWRENLLKIKGLMFGKNYVDSLIDVV